MDLQKAPPPVGPRWTPTFRSEGSESHSSQVTAPPPSWWGPETHRTAGSASLLTAPPEEESRWASGPSASARSHSPPCAQQQHRHTHHLWVKSGTAHQSLNPLCLFIISLLLLFNFCAFYFVKCIFYFILFLFFLYC